MKFLSHVRYSGDGSQRENGSSLSACHVWLHASYCITTMKPSFQQKLSAQRKVWKKFNRVDPLKKKSLLGESLGSLILKGGDLSSLLRSTC